MQLTSAVPRIVGLWTSRTDSCNQKNWLYLRKAWTSLQHPDKSHTKRYYCSHWGLCRVPEEDADSARLRIIGILFQARPPSANLSASERRAIKLLQDDDNILILPADKGRATVVMDRQDYEQKICLLLDDSHTYKKLSKDPSQCLERKMNAMLLELKRKGSLSEQLYSHLHSSAGQTPPLYSLPKIH